MPVFPWVSSRELLITQQGKFDLTFPPDCPVLVHFVEFSAEHAVAPNYHDHLELSYVFAGRGRFTIEGRSYDCCVGDLFLVGGGEFHSLRAVNGPGPSVISVYWMPEFVHRTGGPELDLQYLMPFYARQAGNRMTAADLRGQPVLDWILRIHNELQQVGPFRTLAVRTYLLNLLLAIAQSYGHHTLDTDGEERKQRDFERLRMVFERIQGSYHEDLELKEAAGLAGMSPAYFCRFFRRVTGHSLTDYLLRLRVDRAMELLLSTDLPVTDIAFEVGFGSHSYFDRVFTRLAGRTPSQCRGSIPFKRK